MKILSLLLFAPLAHADVIDDLIARGLTNAPEIIATNTAFTSNAVPVVPPWLPPSVDKSEGLPVIRFSARRGAVYFLNARNATSQKWRAVSPQFPAAAPRMGWQVAGTNVVKYYQVMEGWRAGTNINFAPAGIATNR